MPIWPCLRPSPSSDQTLVEILLRLWSRRAKLELDVAESMRWTGSPRGDAGVATVMWRVEEASASAARGCLRRRKLKRGRERGGMFMWVRKRKGLAVRSGARIGWSPGVVGVVKYSRRGVVGRCSEVEGGRLRGWEEAGVVTGCQSTCSTGLMRSGRSSGELMVRCFVVSEPSLALEEWPSFLRRYVDSLAEDFRVVLSWC